MWIGSLVSGPRGEVQDLRCQSSLRARFGWPCVNFGCLVRVSVFGTIQSNSVPRAEARSVDRGGLGASSGACGEGNPGDGACSVQGGRQVR